MTDEDDRIYPAGVWADIAIEAVKAGEQSSIAVAMANRVTDAYIKRFGSTD